MRTAVIVAAGLGSRLKDRTQQQPKGFLEVEGSALVETSIGKLRRAGFERLVIGTGYLAEHYDALAERYRGTFQIETLRSDRFATTGSMYTLYCLRSILDEDFVLLESDLLYEQRALTALLEDPRPDIVLVSGFTDSRDEVWVEVDADSNLLDLSKKRDALGSVHGELVGISKIARDTYRAMCAVMADEVDRTPKLDYEGCLVRVARQGKPIPVMKIDDLAWCEIDDEGHLKRALDRILPAIRSRES
ncbi:MAG: phosphocholine cytidylyltransferase family protein [Myxococcota bacterium]